MREIRIKLDAEMLDKVVLTDLIESFKMVEREIIELYERSKNETLPDFKRTDLEDNLDLRSHLKAVIKYHSTKTERESYRLYF